MNTLIIQPKNKAQLETVTAFLKALKIEFSNEISTQEKNVYNAKYAAKLKRGLADMEAGRVHKISLDEIWK